MFIVVIIYFKACHKDYDEKFACRFNQYLMGTDNYYFTDNMCYDNMYTENVYIQCIKEHFKANKCPSNKCSELW